MSEEKEIFAEIKEFEEYVAALPDNLQGRKTIVLMLNALKDQTEILKTNFLLSFTRYKKSKLAFEADVKSSDYTEDMISIYGQNLTQDANDIIQKGILMIRKSYDSLVKTLKLLEEEVEQTPIQKEQEEPFADLPPIEDGFDSLDD